eukprot:TRINITY_DN12775_c0_g1_i1.p1 TRINITY_DN12775_c0_g1~~TRINITY_DN12775_c0_g1_i1.p1  ORF type:complete len:201 (-),score=42.20 TRINITY_DN12775_c0_g1_i1:3-605(-)
MLKQRGRRLTSLLSLSSLPVIFALAPGYLKPVENKNNENLKENNTKEKSPQHPQHHPQPQHQDPSTNSTAVLKAVQIVTRHGYRTPLSSSFIVPSVTWDCSRIKNHFKTLLHDENKSEKPFYVKHYLPNEQALPGDCYLGQLTSQGFLLMRDLGKRLRERYVADPSSPSSSRSSSNGFLSPFLLPHELYLRSTDVPRTLR